MEIDVEWYYTVFSRDFNRREQVFRKIIFFMPETKNRMKSTVCNML